jgi:hypothetical protein
LLLNRGARRITGSTSYTQHLFLGGGRAGVQS